jgi:hypothetical protein
MVGRQWVAWTVSAVAVTGAVAVIAVLLAIVPARPDSVPKPLVLTRTATATPVPRVEVTATPLPTNAQGHELVQVEGDLMVDPPAYISTWADDPVVSATLLGNRDGKLVFGTLTADDQVGIGIYDPEKSETQGRTVSYDEFVATGLTIDRGSWSVTWTSDGRVVFASL